MSHTSSVVFLRKHWALSQDELADLLGISQAHVCRIEGSDAAKAAKLETALGLQVVFGRAPKTLFSPLHEAIEESVMTRAAEFDLTLRDKHDPESLKKSQLLAAMLKRATSDHRAV